MFGKRLDRLLKRLVEERTNTCPLGAAVIGHGLTKTTTKTSAIGIMTE